MKERYERERRQMQGRSLPALDRRHKCRGEKFFALNRRHKNAKKYNTCINHSTDK
jgi:hypothetical protein